MGIVKLPSRREGLIMGVCLTVWLIVTATFLSMRPEHWFLALLIAGLFCFNGITRRVVVALIPFALFGISYDWMNLAHNYEVNPPVDIQGLYETEKALFGIATAGGVLTPNEYFALHRSLLMDFLGGVFYLCWVPVPILFGLWLYYKKQRMVYLHFAIVFLLVNLIGFAIYYIHPAAPPWYVASHGFDFIDGTHGEVAGLQGFQEITGWYVFDGLYARNSNVYAAVPSLHSAYMPVALYYALRSRTSWWLRGFFIVITVGIWFTAVYTSHHYLIDVILGASVAALGIVVMEAGLMKIPAWRRFMERYCNYITA